MLWIKFLTQGNSSSRSRITFYSLHFFLTLSGTFSKAHGQHASSQLPGHIRVSGTVIKSLKVVKKFPCCVSKFIKIVCSTQGAVYSQAQSCTKKTDISTIWLLLLKQHLKIPESEEWEIDTKNAKAGMKIVANIRWEKALSNGYRGITTFKAPCH